METGIHSLVTVKNETDSHGTYMYGSPVQEGMQKSFIFDPPMTYDLGGSFILVPSDPQEICAKLVSKKFPYFP